MHYRRLGRTNLQVSEIGLGTVELGMDYGLPVDNQHKKPSEADATRLLNQALDLGVNFIDTAHSYGTSEEVIGKAIGHRRSEYILATKMHYFPYLHDNGNDLHGNDLQQAVEKSVYDSLHALKTDYIDIMQMHSVPVGFLRNDLLTILQGFRIAGHIRFIGATTYGENAALVALNNDHIDCLQVAYNLVDREMETKVLPLAKHRDVGIIARSVLLRGALTSRYHVMPPHIQELHLLISDLDGLAYNETMLLPEFAYHYVLSNPTIATALCGTSRQSELLDIIDYATHYHETPLSQDALTTIRFHQLQDRNQLSLEGWSV